MSEIRIRTKGYFLQPINEVPGYLRVRSRGRYHTEVYAQIRYKKEISPRSEIISCFIGTSKVPGRSLKYLKVCEKLQKSVAIQILSDNFFYWPTSFSRYKMAVIKKNGQSLFWQFLGKISQFQNKSSFTSKIEEIIRSF